MLGDVKRAVRKGAFQEKILVYDVKGCIDEVVILGTFRRRVGMHSNDPPIGAALHKVGISRVVIGVREESQVRLPALMKIQHRGKIQVNECIPVENKKHGIKQRERIPQCPPCSARHRFLNILDFDAQPRSATEVRTHDVGTIMDEQQDVGDPLVSQEEDETLQKGNSAHGGHGLGDVCSQCIGKAGSLAPGKNHPLTHGFSLAISLIAN